MYEIMRYWDDDHPEWDLDTTGLRDGMAEAAQMGGLALAEVSGCNATVIAGDDLEQAVRI